MRILLLAHEFRGEDQKKVLRCKILGSVLDFTRVFCPGTKFYSRLGETSSILGAHRPWPYYSFSGHNLRLGGTLLAMGCTSSDLGGTTPNVPRGAGPDGGSVSPLPPYIDKTSAIEIAESGLTSTVGSNLIIKQALTTSCKTISI